MARTFCENYTSTNVYEIGLSLLLFQAKIPVRRQVRIIINRKFNLDKLRGYYLIVIFGVKTYLLATVNFLLVKACCDPHDLAFTTSKVIICGNCVLCDHNCS